MYLEVFKNEHKLLFSKRNTIIIEENHDKNNNYYNEKMKQQRYIKDLFKYNYNNSITDNSFDSESIFLKRMAKVSRASARIELFFYQIVKLFLLFGKKHNKNRDLIRLTKLECSELLKLR